MIKLQTLGMGAAVAAAAFSLFALTANAQQPPAAAPATPGTVAPVKPAAPPAAPAAAKAPATTPAATTPAKPKKVASACKGLDETACKANPECGYIVPTKVDAKTGKADKPYCRKVAGVAAQAKPKPAVAPAAAVTKPAAAAVKPAVPNAAAPVTKQ